MHHHARAASFVVSSLAALFLLASCATSPGGAARDQLAGTSWTARSIQNESLAQDAGVTIQFGEQYRVSGNTGCNDYYGVYVVRDGQFVARNIGATERACEDAAVMAREGRLLEILNQSESMVVDANGQLVVTGEEGRQIVFARAAS
ncbi:MAG: META domain-containing protein [Hyphomonadaceae bacterium]